MPAYNFFFFVCKRPFIFGFAAICWQYAIAWGVWRPYLFVCFFFLFASSLTSSISISIRSFCFHPFICTLFHCFLCMACIHSIQNCILFRMVCEMSIGNEFFHQHTISKDRRTVNIKCQNVTQVFSIQRHVNKCFLSYIICGWVDSSCCFLYVLSIFILDSFFLARAASRSSFVYSQSFALTIHCFIFFWCFFLFSIVWTKRFFWRIHSFVILSFVLSFGNHLLFNHGSKFSACCSFEHQNIPGACTIVCIGYRSVFVRTACLRREWKQQQQ